MNKEYGSDFQKDLTKCKKIGTDFSEKSSLLKNRHIFCKNRYSKTYEFNSNVPNHNMYVQKLATLNLLLTSSCV